MAFLLQFVFIPALPIPNTTMDLFSKTASVSSAGGRSSSDKIHLLLRTSVGMTAFSMETSTKKAAISIEIRSSPKQSQEGQK